MTAVAATPSVRSHFEHGARRQLQRRRAIAAARKRVQRHIGASAARPLAAQMRMAHEHGSRPPVAKRPETGVRTVWDAEQRGRAIAVTG